jgi:hypothetical protein
VSQANPRLAYDVYFYEKAIKHLRDFPRQPPLVKNSGTAANYESIQARENSHDSGSLEPCRSKKLESKTELEPDFFSFRYLEPETGS